MTYSPRLKAGACSHAQIRLAEFKPTTIGGLTAAKRKGELPEARNFRAEYSMKGGMNLNIPQVFIFDTADEPHEIVGVFLFLAKLRQYRR